MSCDNCSHSGEMKEVATVPLYAVESQSYRRERTIRATVIVFCVALLIIALLIGACGVFVYRINRDCLDKIDGINRYWIDYIAQYDFANYSYEYAQDGKGLNIIGDNNEVTNDGTTAESDGQETNP